jgi:thiol-disulfide isomerase/thioredoxin
MVCLCAAWCGVCREFRTAFDALAAAHPEARLHWVDIEDQADWVNDLDVENFPTLLLGVNGTPVFYGTTLPHASVAERLMERATGTAPLRGAEPEALDAMQALLQGLAEGRLD